MPRYDLEIKREYELDSATASAEPYRIIDESGQVIDFTGETPSATVYTPGLTEITGVATASIDSNGYISVVIDTTDSNFSLDEDYVLDITCAKNGTTYNRRFYFDVVAVAWQSVFAEIDMAAALPNAIGDSDKLRYVQRGRERFFRELERMEIERYGKFYKIRKALIINRYQFKQQLKNYVMLEYCEDALRSTAGGDRWSYLYEQTRKDIANEWRALAANIVYDFGEDEEVDETDKKFNDTFMVR